MNGKPRGRATVVITMNPWKQKCLSFGLTWKSVIIKWEKTDMDSLQDVWGTTMKTFSFQLRQGKCLWTLEEPRVFKWIINMQVGEQSFLYSAAWTGKKTYVGCFTNQVCKCHGRTGVIELFYKHWVAALNCDSGPVLQESSLVFPWVHTLSYVLMFLSSPPLPIMALIRP